METTNISLVSEMDRCTATIASVESFLPHILSDMDGVSSGELIHPGDLLRAIERFYFARSARSGIKLSIHIADDVPTEVIGDYCQLYQLLLYIVSHAMDECLSGSVKIALQLARSARSDAVQLLFSVSHHGAGMSDQDIDGLMDTGKSAGMAKVRKMLADLNAVMSVDAEEGIGATVYMSLPFKPIQIAQDVPYGMPTMPMYTGRKVLVAEEDNLTRLAMQRFLTGKDFDITIARSGHEALKLIQANRFDAIVMDIGLSDISGSSVTRCIREAGQGYSQVPVVGLGASSVSQDRRLCLESGMNRYLAKPVNLAALSIMLEDVLSS